MNTEEARKVLWLKSNPRPIGELLDGGYLTQDRLEWAAQWAYNPKLQQAAKILLETGKPSEKKIEKHATPNKPYQVPFDIGIGLAKARSTIWPFMPYKGQEMGTLVATKQLSLRDLAYAVENAWDERVRQAAIAFSLMSLEQTVNEPTSSAGFMHVVSSGRSYAERQQSWLMFLDGLITGIVGAIAIFFTVYAVKNFLTPHPVGKSLSSSLSTPFGILAVLVVLGIAVILGLLIVSIPERISDRLTKQIEEYRRGQEGEDMVVELIIQALDGNWNLFRNIDLPGRNRGDLDLVLVGPPGVWVLEVKNFRGKYRNVEENWEYWSGKKWEKASANPSQQAHKNAIRLANFLKADHLNVYVNAAVVWAGAESPLSVENPPVPIWTYNRLADELGNIWQGEKITLAERKKITDKLSKLCERAKKAHQVSLEEQRETG